MKVNNDAWHSEDWSRRFLREVRQAIPLSLEQIDIIIRVLRAYMCDVRSFLDLGCGNGVLGKAVLSQYPQARGVFLDLSESMLDNARTNIGADSDNLDFVVRDFGDRGWLSDVKAPFDVVVSGFAIHHQPDERKKEIYSEIYDILSPGGLFLNLEHVSSESNCIQTAFEELFIDSLYSFSQKTGVCKPREQVAQEFYNRDDKAANILAPTWEQCNWLRDTGFVDVDCFIKIFELALFGGIKPKHG